MPELTSGISPTYLAGSIFLLTYAVIISEKIHRTVAALLGGLAMILLGIVNQEQAFHHAVDWNVFFLLAGMMIIANILSETGLFQWIAVKAVILGNRNPVRTMILLSLVTAISSAALDNVTVVVLIAPVTLFVAANLGISPIPFLIAEVIASNTGGAATLIGDPPNILIGSAAGIDFVTFAANMGPIIIVNMLLFIPLSYLVFRKDLKAKAGAGARPQVTGLENIITDPVLLRKSLLVITAVLLGFTLHSTLHLEPATIAMVGATVLMLWSKKDPHHILQHVEWTTLFFFIGLFITVEAIVQVGIIRAVAEKAMELTGGNLPITTMLVLWMSAILSGVVDNIPYAATMIPLVKELGAGGMKTEPLWWALILGADLGGNFTIIGASANVVVAGLAERNGHKISFGSFFKYSLPITFVSIAVSSVYLWLRYLM